MVNPNARFIWTEQNSNMLLPFAQLLHHVYGTEGREEVPVYSDLFSI